MALKRTSPRKILGPTTFFVPTVSIPRTWFQPWLLSCCEDPQALASSLTGLWKTAVYVARSSLFHLEPELQLYGTVYFHEKQRKEHLPISSHDHWACNTSCQLPGMWHFHDSTAWLTDFKSKHEGRYSGLSNPREKLRLWQCNATAGIACNIRYGPEP